MRTVRLQAYGEPDQLKAEDIPTPVPGAGEVLLKLEASSVNHLDLLIRQGYLAQMIPLDFPATLGLDGAGTVVAAGPGVSGFAAGDRVIAHFPLNGKGAQAEFGVVPVAGVAKLPATLTFEQGATLPTVGLTGKQTVDALGLQGGERVLVAGALSAVGRIAVYYLQQAGAVPVAGVLPDEVHEAKQIAGVAVDITQSPAAPTFDYAIVTVQAAAANAIKSVRDGGKVVSTVQPPDGANPNVRFEMIMHHDDPVTLQSVADAAGRGEVVIPTAQTFPLAQLREAHTALAAGPRGKIVLVHG